MKAIKYGSNNKGNGDPFPLKHMFVYFLCNMPNLKKIHLLLNTYVQNHFKLKTKGKLRIRVQNNQSMFLRLRLLYLNLEKM